MYTLFLMNVRHCADQLCEDLLHFRRFDRAAVEEMVVKFIAGAPLKNEPYHRLGDYDFVEARDVRVDELAMVVDFSCEVRVVLFGALEDDLRMDLLVLSHTSLPVLRISTFEPLVSLCVAR